MKILIIPANDWVFGPRQYFHDIAEILAEKHDVYVWHFHLFRSERPFLQEARNVKLVSSRSIFSKNLLMYYVLNFIPHSLSFSQVVRSIGADVVIVLNLIPALWGFPLAPPKTLKVFGFQDYYPESVLVYYRGLPRMLQRFMETAALIVNRLSIKLADITVCGSLALMNQARKMGCRRNYFLPNGVDTEFFSSSKYDDHLGIQMALSNRTLVFFGLTEDWLDFGTVFDGLRILRREFSDIRMLVIGSTLTGYAETLKKLVYEKGLTATVLLKGYLPSQLIPYYLNLATACIMPYKHDTYSGSIRLPLKFFIYSAMAKPILSVPLPEVKRLKPKHVLYYHDSVSFAGCVKRIFDDRDFQNRLKAYARDFAQDFDYHILAEKCEAILEKNRQAR